MEGVNAPYTQIDHAVKTRRLGGRVGGGLLLLACRLLDCTAASAMASVSISEAQRSVRASGTQQMDDSQVAMGAGAFARQAHVAGIVTDGNGFPSGDVRGDASLDASITTAFVEASLNVAGFGVGNAGTAFGTGYGALTTSLQVDTPVDYTLTGELLMSPFDTSVSAWRSVSLCFRPVGEATCQIEFSEIFFDDVTQLSLSEAGTLSPGQYELLAAANAGGTFHQEAFVDLQWSLQFAPVPTDVDRLGAAVREQSTDLQFDLDGSESIDDQDLVYFVAEYAHTWFGDFDFNGLFDTGDLVGVFQAGQYDDGIVGNATWATGDWNQDLEFDSADLVVALRDGGFEQGLRTNVTQVPEPTHASTLGLIIMAAYRRSFRGARRRRK